MHVVTSFSDYQSCLGTAFRVDDEEAGVVPLTLTSATVVHDTPRQFVFSLLFAAPPPLLPQKTHRLHHDRLGELHLFLVPVGQTSDGFTYEAAFNLLRAPESV